MRVINTKHKLMTIGGFKTKQLLNVSVCVLAKSVRFELNLLNAEHV